MLKNDHVEELVLRVERTAQRVEALTAARAAASGLFRELFPGEILESGMLVSVAAVTLLVLDLNNATDLETPDNLYEALGEARTFGLLHEYFRLVEDTVRLEGGAVIKTLGETMLSAFEDRAAAVCTSLALASILVRELNGRWPDLPRRIRVRVGVHHGPAMTATLNGTLDYVGTTVDQALRLPGLLPGGHLGLSPRLGCRRAYCRDPAFLGPESQSRHRQSSRTSFRRPLERTLAVLAILRVRSWATAGAVCLPQVGLTSTAAFGIPPRESLAIVLGIAERTPCYVP